MKVLLTATVQSHICQFHRPLVSLLHKHGCEVHVAAKDNLAEKNGLKLDFVDKVYNVPFSRSPKSTDNIRAYKELKKIIKSNSYDVIHCNTPMGGIVTRLAARKARTVGTKVYYTAHGFHFYKGAPKKNWFIYYPIEKWMSRLTDVLITITQEDYHLAKKKFHTNIKYIHGVGVDQLKYLSINPEDNEAFRHKMGYNNRFIILCTGELNDNKNQFTIIKAAQQLAKKRPEILVLLAGNGPREVELKKNIADMQLHDHVHMLGYCTDLEKYVNVSDMVVSASYREGLPLNIMEALLCGKPVVASNNRGHRELIENEVNGILVEYNESKYFQESIENLMDSFEKRLLFKKNARKMIVPFTMSNVEKELKEIYGL